MAFNKFIKINTVILMALAPFVSSAQEPLSLINDIIDNAPEYYQLFNKKTQVLDLDVMTQENLFDQDGVKYDTIDILSNPYSQKYTVDKVQETIDSKHVLTNKIRLMAGMPPISKLDNKPVLLCKVDKGLFIEVAEIQIMEIAAKLSTPINYKAICTKNGGVKPYWTQRYYDFYNEFGGLR